MPRMPFLKSQFTGQDLSKLSTEKSSTLNALTGRSFLPFGGRSPIGLQDTGDRHMCHLTFLVISNIVVLSICYQIVWERALQASAKAGKAEVA